MKDQPVRFVNGHSRRLPEGYRVVLNGCWIWIGVTRKDGYGSLSRHGKRILAHRWHYEQAKGPIPDGLVIDHLCRNPSCVNPDHLEPVSQRINVLRGVGASAGHAAKTHCKHGHPFSGENVAIDARGWRTCITCRRAKDARRRPRRRRKVA